MGTSKSDHFRWKNNKHDMRQMSRTNKRIKMVTFPWEILHIKKRYKHIQKGWLQLWWLSWSIVDGFDGIMVDRSWCRKGRHQLWWISFSFFKWFWWDNDGTMVDIWWCTPKKWVLLGLQQLFERVHSRTMKDRKCVFRILEFGTGHSNILKAVIRKC